MRVLTASQAQGELITVSGGGRIYHVQDKPDFVYKELADPKDMVNVCALSSQWKELAGTDWVIPEIVVTSENHTQPVGYVMRMAPGDPLHTMECRARIS